MGTYFITGYWMKQYGTGNKGCQGCPASDSCKVNKPKSKRILIRETIDKPYYDLMHERMETAYARRMMRLRQSTVEPVIGSLVNYTGIGRVHTKGLALANKCITLAAIAYNLKKMVKNKGKSAQNRFAELTGLVNTCINKLLSHREKIKMGNRALH